MVMLAFALACGNSRNSNNSAGQLTNDSLPEALVLAVHLYRQFNMSPAHLTVLLKVFDHGGLQTSQDKPCLLELCFQRTQKPTIGQESFSAWKPWFLLVGFGISARKDLPPRSQADGDPELS